MTERGPHRRLRSSGVEEAFFFFSVRGMGGCYVVGRRYATQAGRQASVRMTWGDDVHTHILCACCTREDSVISRDRVSVQYASLHRKTSAEYKTEQW